MAKKLKKQKLPNIFVQPCGHYHDDVLVMTSNVTLPEVKKYLDKLGSKPKFVKWVEEEFDEWKADVEKKSLGLFCENDKLNTQIIMLRPLQDCWEYWDTVAHEVHHLTLSIAKKRTFSEEMENQAYLFELLFRGIRRKLTGVDPTQ